MIVEIKKKKDEMFIDLDNTGYIISKIKKKDFKKYRKLNDREYREYMYSKTCLSNNM